MDSSIDPREQQESTKGRAHTSGTSSVCLVDLVSLVHLVDLVYLVGLVQSNNRDRPVRPDGPDRPDRPNRPNEQDRLADFFSILLDHRPTVEEWRKTGDRDEPSERGGRQLRTRLGTMNEMGDAKLFCRNQTTLIIIHEEGPGRIESQ